MSSGRENKTNVSSAADERAKRLMETLSEEEKKITDIGASIIKSGGLVAFPTETVYGLGANALSAAAVSKIYETKGRPSDNPLILHVSSVEMAEELVYVNAASRRLMEKFWPGPLTVVLPAKDTIPGKTRGGLSTAAVRMPAAAVALALIEKSRLPIAAPSANISGRPSPTDAKTVSREIGDKIELVIDGGDAKIGVESTVLDMTGDAPVLLRPGGLPKEFIEEALATKVFSTDDEKTLKRSPGTRYRHYAPLLPLKLTHGGEAVSEREKWAWLGTEEPQGKPFVKIIFKDDAEYAKGLFRALRTLEASGAEIIYAQKPAARGIGLALLDRLRRASGEE